MKQFHLLVFLILVIGCANTNNAIANQGSLENPQDSCKEQLKTIINFLNWYRNYSSQDHDYVTVNNYGEGYNTNNYYSVNYSGTERYLNDLKNSGFISEKYINQWREYFKKCELNFKKNPQNDGPPEGLDFDFIMWSQDYEEEFKTIDKLVVVNFKKENKQCYLKVIFPVGSKLEFYMSKTNNGWIIDDIKNGN
jgi:hypothetical protein